MFRRALQVVLLGLVAVTVLGADNSTTRLEKIGHQLVCQCGCGQILSECNHVGCPVSPVMLDELRAQLATSLPNSGVLAWFSNKYGPIVLAAPIRGGFDTVAWIVPFALFGLGLLGVVLLMRVWRRRYAVSGPAVPVATTPETDSLRDRIRNETNYGE
jgi:cytochrome c-type biogenesis protein CcmH/NrfF